MGSLYKCYAPQCTVVCVLCVYAATHTRFLLGCVISVYVLSRTMAFRISVSYHTLYYKW